MTLEPLIAEAKALGILQPARAIDVHCPNCQARLHAYGECPSCGLVGWSEERLRGLEPGVASALLQRSIARRKSWVPAKRPGAKSVER